LDFKGNKKINQGIEESSTNLGVFHHQFFLQDELDKGNEKKSQQAFFKFSFKSKTKTSTNKDPPLYIGGMDGNDTIFPTKVN